MSADAVSPPSRDEILALVRTQLAEILEIDAASIGEDATFEDLGADSLALIELVEAIEEGLSDSVAGFHIDDEDLEGLASVRSAVDYVAAKLHTA
jgi:acyl carrier protein